MPGAELLALGKRVDGEGEVAHVRVSPRGDALQSLANAPALHR